MDVVHARCAGLDVHKETVVACVRRQRGRQVEREAQTFGTTTAELLRLGDWLESQGCTTAVLEATGVYWKPVWHLLEDRLELQLAHAATVRQVPGRKSDVTDAAWLADLLAHGLIRGSFVPPRAIQELRDLTRTRQQLVRQVAQATLRIQKTLEDANIKVTASSRTCWARAGERSCGPGSPGRLTRSGSWRTPPAGCALRGHACSLACAGT